MRRLDWVDWSNRWLDLMDMCVLKHIYIHIDVSWNTYTYIYMCVETHIHTYTCVLKHIYIHIHVCWNTYTYIYMCLETHIHTYRCVLKHIYIHIHTRVYHTHLEIIESIPTSWSKLNLSHQIQIILDTSNPIHEDNRTHSHILMYNNWSNLLIRFDVYITTLK